MKNLILYSLLVISMLSCDNTKDQKKTGSNSEESALTLQFSSHSFKTESATCATDSMKCASVAINYLIAENAPKAILKNINDTLNWYYTNAITSFGEDDFSADVKLEEAGNFFINEYEVFLKDMSADEDEHFITPWAIEVESGVEHISDQIASIMMGTYSYTGGAHPNYFSTILNFDVKTGKRLKVEDFLKDEAALTKIAEESFRAEAKLEPGQSLDEAGYFWGETFGLPENMGFTKEGLKLYYNPYEIAAYALGVTEFVIPYEKLEGILKLK